MLVAFSEKSSIFNLLLRLSDRRAKREMDFIWNDGGRTACGFVGLSGDCVTRSIAIATGSAYRDVYEALGKTSEKSPRNGVPTAVASDYLAERNWHRTEGFNRAFIVGDLPKSIVIVHLAKRNDRSQHFSTVIDRVVHDTWNPSDDEDYLVKAFWTVPETRGNSNSEMLIAGSKHSSSDKQELTQTEFDKILNRLRALDRTATNTATTEGEKHNALRMMQSLMLRHNLTREDIVGNDNVDSVQFTRITCHVNGRRACSWEKMLASYVTDSVFTTTQWYWSSKSNRTLFCFYGPLADVRNAVALFREILLTIATSAHLQFGGHSRGSGASYAEGYVQGLPRSQTFESTSQSEKVLNEGALIQTRTLALQSAANDWLNFECNMRLERSTGTGRYRHDEVAASHGKLHGSKHEVAIPNAPRRITQQ